MRSQGLKRGGGLIGRDFGRGLGAAQRLERRADVIGRRIRHRRLRSQGLKRGGRLIGRDFGRGLGAAQRFERRANVIGRFFGDGYGRAQRFKCRGSFIRGRIRRRGRAVDCQGREKRGVLQETLDQRLGP